MSSGQTMNYCRTCAKKTIFIGPDTSHLLHLVLSIITMGIWLPVWIIVHMNNATKMACSQCGRMRGLFG